MVATSKSVFVPINVDPTCVHPPYPPNNTNCNECACLFNYMNCSCSYSEHCLNVAASLGLNCSTADGPVQYVVGVVTNTVNSKFEPCLLQRICNCLLRDTNDIDLEDACYKLCLKNDGDTADSVTGALKDNDEVCSRVKNQFCRRHTKNGRSTKCARICVEGDTCVSNITYHQTDV